MSKVKQTEEYTDEEAAKRAADAIRRSFATPHKPRKVIAPATKRGEAQRKRRAISSPKSR
jgi:hypothetical protein